jgi:hypothetical protein
LGLDSFIARKIVRKKKNNNNNTNNNNPTLKGKWIIIVIGIVIAAIGFAGAIFYGSQFVKVVSTGTTLQYTNPSQTKNILPVDLEIVFVVIGVIGFGIFTYGFARRVDKPFDFYPI